MNLFTKFLPFLIFIHFEMHVSAQEGSGNNTLLWKVIGKDLQKPSYLFGTHHALCKEDAKLGDSLIFAIKSVDLVYFESNRNASIDPNIMREKSIIKGGSTWKDYLSPEDYEWFKNYFQTKIPWPSFSVIEKGYPLNALLLCRASNGGRNSSTEGCQQTSMENVIFDLVKSLKKQHGGLETQEDQMTMIEKISIEKQFYQLKNAINNTNSTHITSSPLYLAYVQQNYNKLCEMFDGMDRTNGAFGDSLFLQRDGKLLNAFQMFIPKKSVIFCVGAAHVIGKYGLVEGLRKEGYTVTPVLNKK